MDVETTGLDTQHDRILEIGLIVTDDNLIPLDEGFHSIIRYSGETSEFITAMHTPNGLLAECAAPGAPTLPEAGEQARGCCPPEAACDSTATSSPTRGRTCSTDARTARST